MTPNPFLSRERLSPFDQLRPEQIRPAVEALEPQLMADLQALEAKTPTAWEDVFPALDDMEDRLERCDDLIDLMLTTRDNGTWVDGPACQSRLRAIARRISHSRPVFKQLCWLKERADEMGLSEAQQRALRTRLSQARLDGVALVGAHRARFDDIEERLEALRSRFSANLMAERRSWSLTITDPAKVEGMPKPWKRMTAQTARSAGHEEATPQTGPWVATIDWTSIGPLLRHCRDRELRRAARAAWANHGARPPSDNPAIVEEVLTLRQEKARLLGFDNYAEMATSVLMSGSAATVRRMLSTLDKTTLDAALREREEISNLAARVGAPEAGGLKVWDLAFWQQRLIEQVLGFDADAIRPYLSFDNVMSGLIELLDELLGISLRAVDGVAPVWHPDVRLYETRDSASGEIYGHLYFDPYTRPGEKMAGGWTKGIVCRSKSLAAEGQSHRKPVAVVVLNLNPPTQGTPALMSTWDLQSIFHEMGHALHILVTEVDEATVAGTRGVEWDAVELPSMFLETWAKDKNTLRRFARHHKTGEPIPEGLLEEFDAFQRFRGATGMRSQYTAALVDLELHERWRPDQGPSPHEVDLAIRSHSWLTPMPEDEHWLCSFAHIFVGGYASRTYAYYWSEMLATAAFATFENCRSKEEWAAQGRRFREIILAQGGAKHPASLIVEFLGHTPTLEPLLKQRGVEIIPDLQGDLTFLS